MNPTFDAAWQDRALAGDAQAIGQLADTVLPPLYRFCYHRVGRRQDLCEEVVQETLMRAIRDLRLYDPGRSTSSEFRVPSSESSTRNPELGTRNASMFGWLTGLARNEIRRVLAHRSDTVSLNALWDHMDAQLLDILGRLNAQPLGQELLEREETCQLVNATMAQLPTGYRETLEAKYVQGQSVRDIAAAHRISEKAAESQLTRARQAFREVFLALTKRLGAEAVRVPGRA